MSRALQYPSHFPSPTRHENSSNSVIDIPKSRAMWLTVRSRIVSTYNRGFRTPSQSSCVDRWVLLVLDFCHDDRVYSTRHHVRATSRYRVLTFGNVPTERPTTQELGFSLTLESHSPDVDLSHLDCDFTTISGF